VDRVPTYIHRLCGATVTNLGDDGKLLELHPTNLVQVRNI